MDEISVVERLARIETQLSVMDKKLDQHLERHYSLGVKTFLALLGAGLSMLVSLLK